MRFSEIETGGRLNVSIVEANAGCRIDVIAVKHGSD